jgi:hypothetical protein
VLTGVLATMLISLSRERVSAFSGAPPDSDLAGLVIRPDDVPRDERGRARPELLGLPFGSIPRQPSANVAERRLQLRERYDRAVRALRLHSFPTRISPAGTEANEPPAMDSGDPNPDRAAMNEGER